MHVCEVRSECDADSILSLEAYWHVYLPKFHTRGKIQVLKLDTSVTFEAFDNL
jgi:hypothetical protein